MRGDGRRKGAHTIALSRRWPVDKCRRCAIVGVSNKSADRNGSAEQSNRNAAARRQGTLRRVEAPLCIVSELGVLKRHCDRG
jgi:ribosome-binding protein aMBF1 (putative translation factor)